MPNSGRRRGEQWDSCSVCGRSFPISQLGYQKGVRKCYGMTCWENLTIERHATAVMQVLGTTPEEEGSDRRWVDNAFFHQEEMEIQ